MPAGDGNLNVALVIQASSAQAKAALAEVQAQIAAVNEESAKTAGTAATASDAVVTAAAAEASAARDVGAAQAERAGFTRQTSDEIAAMVRNSLAAVEADRAAAKAAADAATARRAEGAAASASAKSNAELAAAQTAQMSRYTAMRAPVLELQQLLTKSTLTSTEVAQAELLLDRAQASGAISAGELKEAFAALDAAKIKDVAATEAQTAANVEATVALNSRARREIGTVGAEALSGNFGRVRTSGLAFANDLGLFTKLLSPAGLAIAGTTAAVVALAAAFAKGQAESAAFNNALILTGGYAGQSSAQLQALAIQLDGLNGVTEHAAAAVITQVAATGQFYGDQVQMVSRAALQMQQATGQSVETTIQQFQRLGTDPVAGILKLDDTMHFLTQSVYDQITALVQQGQTEQAAAVAQHALADAIDKRTTLIQQNVGLLQAAWEGLKNAAKEAWDSMLNIGRSDAGATLSMWQAQLDTARKNLATPGLDDSTIRIFMQQANQAQAEIDQLSGKTTADAKQVSDALKAQQQLAQAGITPLQTYLKTVADLTNTYKTAIAGANDDTKATALANLQTALKKASDDYNASQPKASKGARTPVDHSAEQLAREGAAAQQALAQSLIATQTALSPTAAIWAKYNAQVEQNNANAAKAIAANQGNAASIDAVRDAANAGAAAIRDSALQKQIDDTRKAWEQFQLSIGMPIDVNSGQAVKKLQELYDWLQKLKGTAQAPSDSQTSGMLGDILMTGVDSNIRLRSQRLLPGQNRRTDPLALVNEDQQNEDANFAKQQAQLQKNYAAAQSAAQGNYQKLLQLQQAYNADSDKLNAQHDQTNQQIQQARYWGEVQVASDAFGELAQLWAQRYGTENRTYAVLFALSKAFSIAQAAVSLATNISKASEVGYPQNIPLIIGAMAQGAEIMSMLMGANFSGGGGGGSGGGSGGYAEGGYTGPGAKHQVAGVVHAGEVVWSQADIARAGGVPTVEALRRGVARGYADGGVVLPSAYGLTPEEVGFPSLVRPKLDMQALSAANARAVAPQVNVKTVIVQNADQLAAEILNTPTGTKLVIQHVGNNPNAIQGKWRS